MTILISMLLLSAKLGTRFALEDYYFGPWHHVITSPTWAEPLGEA
jgi:hypothetical protein